MYNELIKHTAYPSDYDAIVDLINKGVNPFECDQFGNSAFSVALRDELLDLAKMFIKMGNIDLYNESVGTDNHFVLYIGHSLLIPDSLFLQVSGFDDQARQTCFCEVLDSCARLDEDTSALLNLYNL